jgi:hypothetical protein
LHGAKYEIENEESSRSEIFDIKSFEGENEKLMMLNQETCQEGMFRGQARQPFKYRPSREPNKNLDQVVYLTPIVFETGTAWMI